MYFTQVNNSYRGLAAQIKQGRDRRRPWRNLLGCYREKLERLLCGEEDRGRMRSVKTPAGQLRKALEWARTARVSIWERRRGARWHAAWLSPAPYECPQALPATAHRHPQQTQPGIGIRVLRILANSISAHLRVPWIDRS